MYYKLIIITQFDLIKIIILQTSKEFNIKFDTKQILYKRVPVYNWSTSFNKVRGGDLSAMWFEKRDKGLFLQNSLLTYVEAVQTNGAYNQSSPL